MTSRQRDARPELGGVADGAAEGVRMETHLAAIERHTEARAERGAKLDEAKGAAFSALLAIGALTLGALATAALRGAGPAEAPAIVMEGSVVEEGAMEESVAHHAPSPLGAIETAGAPALPTPDAADAR